ncbi:MAG: hypothetical protein ACJ74H_12470 [Thermoanaerobaculia bacterium]
MTKVVTAEYDAAHNTLRLVEPLDGVRDHEKVQVQVIATRDDAQPPWMALRGSLSKEAGDELAQALEELFPPWND